jgi:hypothetical protein
MLDFVSVAWHAPPNQRLKLSALLLKEALCYLMFSTSAAA